MTTTDLTVGDRVAYSRKFLQDTAQHTGPMPFRRGVITAVDGIGSGILLATIAWDGEGSSRARTSILVREDRIRLEPV